jgi:hypothetical protein
LLDLVGGTFSLASGTMSISNGVNVTKVVLAGVTILYDLLFVFQHYCLYNQKDWGKRDLTIEEISSSNIKDN